MIKYAFLKFNMIDAGELWVRLETINGFTRTSNGSDLSCNAGNAVKIISVSETPEEIIGMIRSCKA